MIKQADPTLSGRHILVGITGGIAAYKAAELVRLFVKAGANVRVVMTEGAKAFITPMTLQALSGHPVHDSLWDLQAEAAMGHIELAKWADWIVVAPASADVLAKFAHGLADDLLSTLMLATTAKVLLAPAMNQQMWQAPATKANVALLEQRGFHVLEPGEGEQACGDVGPGRLPEPPIILAALIDLMSSGLLTGKHIVITAGPTQEPLDPVRFISNHSSGKMGYALASEARAMGAKVTLISGPTALGAPVGVNLVKVDTAEAMLAATLQAMPCDIFIAAAAVADYRPVTSVKQKLAKQSDALSLALTTNPDILAKVCALADKPYCVGFAAQTEDLLEKAREKLLKKGADVIVANLVGPNLGFGVDENQVTLVRVHEIEAFPLMSKTKLAKILLEKFSEYRNKRES